MELTEPRAFDAVLSLVYDSIAAQNLSRGTQWFSKLDAEKPHFVRYFFTAFTFGEHQIAQSSWLAKSPWEPVGQSSPVLLKSIKDSLFLITSSSLKTPVVEI